MNTRVYRSNIAVVIFLSIVLNLSFGFGAVAGYDGAIYLNQAIMPIFSDILSSVKGVLPEIVYGLIVFLICATVFILLIRRLSVKKMVALLGTNPYELFRYIPASLALGFFFWDLCSGMFLYFSSCCIQ